MKKTFIRLFITTIVFITITNGAFSQSQTDTTKEDLDRVFTKAEVKPSFKAGAEALDNYLTQNINTSDAGKNESGTVVFIVSAKGDIYQFTNTGGNLSFADALKTALRKSSGQWNSAMQNNYHVNAYCHLTITFHKNKIQAVIE
ncbi:MAG: hypothetical protein ABI358_08685 [Ginsengibacter sp.]